MKKVQKVVVVFVLIVPVILIVLPAYAEDDAELFKKAIEKARDGNYEEAITIFDKILENNPQHESVLINKGSSLLNLERYNEALEIFDKVLQINPTNQEALNNKGIALLNLERHAEAIDTFNIALELNPQNTAVLQNKRIAFDLLGRKPIDGSKYLAYVQIEIRNSNNDLVGYFESDRITYMPYSLTDEYLDSLPNREMLSINGNDYEVWKVLLTVVSEKDDFIGNTILQTPHTKPHYTLFSALHHGYIIDKGDTLRVLWTIMRLVS